ncbi:hypothetical protein HDV01_007034 [Terramyces sp. JEL0728]|nr:hypothetical protein HDV01_007034 [Terramyces sp. JEL0728]
MAWLPKLKDTVKRNSTRENTVVQCASVRTDGTPKIHSLVYRDFLKDSNLIIFSGSSRDPDMMSVMKKSTSAHELYWNYPKETFIMAGRMYIVASPNLSHRLGTPPRRLTNDPNPEEFWEKERERQWKTLSREYRASFSWPVSGELLKPSETATWSAYKGINTVKQSYGLDVGYKYTSLDAMPIKQLSLAELKSRENNPQAELENVHQMAFDNFCLLIFKPTKVDHTVIPRSGVPQRFIYSTDKDNWDVEEVNP